MCTSVSPHLRGDVLVSVGSVVNVVRRQEWLKLSKALNAHLSYMVALYISFLRKLLWVKAYAE